MRVCSLAASQEVTVRQDLVVDLIPVGRGRQRGMKPGMWDRPRPLAGPAGGHMAESS